MALDPGLLALGRYQDKSMSVVVRPSAAIVQRGIEEYLMGRIDYDVLLPGIIKALMELSDMQFDGLMVVINRLGPLVMTKDSGLGGQGNGSKS